MPDPDATLEKKLDAIAASLADVIVVLEQQRQDLHLALEVIAELGAKVDGAAAVSPPPSPRESILGRWRQRS
jgi:hypothetical protein